MRKLIALALAILPVAVHPEAVSVTLDWCQTRARENHPLARQYGLAGETERFAVESAATGYLPRVAVSGKATDQSDATGISLNIPGIAIKKPTTGQYQILAEVSETLWDGGLSGIQGGLARASGDMDRRKIDVDLYALRDRVDQLFFGILLVDGQLAQNSLLLRELETNYGRVSAYVENGVATGADLDAIRVEQLNAGQARDALSSSRRSLCAQLSLMTGAGLGEDTLFVKPEPVSLAASGMPAAAGRPEFALFDSRARLLAEQKRIVISGVQPRLGAFFQAGWGKPGLNMLSDEPAGFWVGGLRLYWALDGFYTVRNSLAKIDADIAGLQVQRDLFVWNQDLLSVQQREDITRLRALTESDGEIILLRARMKDAAWTKVRNGTMAVSDLVREITAENLARQTRSLHEIQLLSSEYTLACTNNY